MFSYIMTPKDKKAILLTYVESVIISAKMISIPLTQPPCSVHSWHLIFAFSHLNGIFCCKIPFPYFRKILNNLRQISKRKAVNGKKWGHVHWEIFDPAIKMLLNYVTQTIVSISGQGIGDFLISRRFCWNKPTL